MPYRPQGWRGPVKGLSQISFSRTVISLETDRTDQVYRQAYGTIEYPQGIARGDRVAVIDVTKTVVADLEPERGAQHE